MNFYVNSDANEPQFSFPSGFISSVSALGRVLTVFSLHSSSLILIL